MGGMPQILNDLFGTSAEYLNSKINHPLGAMSVWRVNGVVYSISSTLKAS